MATPKLQLVRSDATFQPLWSPQAEDTFNAPAWIKKNGVLVREHHPQVVHTAEKERAVVMEDRVNGLRFEDWLPFASPSYKISPDPNDYILRPVVAIISDLPNRNGVGFPTSELTKWNVDGGCQAYRTWIGKPMHSEHGQWHPDPENPDPELAIGVIVDVAMTPLVGFGNNKLWKVLMLAAIDRTKDRERAKRIDAGTLNTYSMGALVNYYTCSYCGKVVGQNCNHIDPEDPVVLYRIRDELVYRLCAGVMGVELSSVGDPAYGIATSDVDHIAY